MVVSSDVEATGTAQQHAWAERRLPPAEQVRPSLWSIPVPMPDHPLRYVLSYCLVDQGEAIVFDPGWPTDVGWAALLQGLRQAGVSPQQIVGIVLTHAHIDHSGLAGRLQREAGCWVAAHSAEWPLVCGPGSGEAERTARIRSWLRACGAAEDDAAAISSAGGTLPSAPVPVRLGRELQDGESLTVGSLTVDVFWTPGHSPGHCCFLVPRHQVLIAGDHLLPRISPNISAFVGHPDSALTDYLRSLRSTSRLDVDEVLPAHEYRFRGAAARSTQMQAHHAARLEEVAALLSHDTGLSGYQIAAALTWSREWGQIGGFQRRAAIGEAQAHLYHLRYLRRAADQDDADGVQRWFTARG